jgi:hypothetical protein
MVMELPLAKKLKSWLEVRVGTPVDPTANTDKVQFVEKVLQLVRLYPKRPVGSIM